MRYRFVVLTLLMMTGFPCAARSSSALLLADGSDLTSLSLEQLLNVEISTASHFSQKTSDAPSSVSVLHAEDFRDYGWRTLADALNSVRGFFVNTDRTYRYAGVRGFTPPGDYNFRLLLLIDGMRTNDNVYDQAYLGNDFHLDVDLIDRIEIVRGPNSTVYGANAVFGVINVITKRGKDYKQGELAASLGSHGSSEARVTLGGSLDRGGDYLLSVTGNRYGGQSLYFPEFAASASRETDREAGGKVFGKLNYGDFSVMAGVSQREKHDPTGFYGKVFNDPTNRFQDKQGFFDARYAGQLRTDLTFNARVFYNSYDYRYHGRYNDVLVGRYTQLDQGLGRWWGGELRLLYSGWQGHKLGLGVDYQNNARQDQKNYTLDRPGLACAVSGSANACLDSQQHGYRFGLTLTDEIELNDAFRLSAGLRFDRANASKDHVSPRLGLVYKARPEATLKVLYGSAYRAPNAYERYFSNPGAPPQQGNPALKAEVVDTYELVWEQYLSQATRFVANAYHYTIKQWSVQIDTGAMLQYRNQGVVSGKGLDFELEQRFSNGANVRGSLVTQWTPARPQGFLNAAPKHMVKLNAATPLFGNPALRLGLESLYVGSRPKESGKADAYFLVNTTLRWLPQGEKGMEVSASIYNLFNRTWERVFTDDSLSSGVTREVLAQDGRMGRIKVVWPF